MRLVAFFMMFLALCQRLLAKHRSVDFLKEGQGGVVETICKRFDFRKFENVFFSFLELFSLDGPAWFMLIS